MAVTWAASAPHATAVKEVQIAGLISGYGPSGSSVFVNCKWPGNKRAVLTKLTATGTYTAGGDAAPAPSVFGLKEVHAAFIVASSTANVVPALDGQAGGGTPTITVTSPTAPKVQVWDDGVDGTAAITLTGDTFHVILVGI